MKHALDKWNGSVCRQSQQRGATMLVGLVMLVLLTLLAISAFNTSNVELKVVGNMQARQEAQAAGGKAIAQVLSSVAFTVDPVTVGATPINVDINQDLTTDYVVTVTPTCVKQTPVFNVDLDISNPEDFKCFAGGHFGTGSGGTGAGVYSNCANSLWDVQAQVQDATSAGTVTTIHQGVTKRVSVASVETFCK